MYKASNGCKQPQALSCLQTQFVGESLIQSVEMNSILWITFFIHGTL